MSEHYDINWPVMRLVFDQSLNYTADELLDNYDYHGIEELIEYQTLLADMEKAHSLDSDNKK